MSSSRLSRSEALEELREQGVALLRGAVSQEAVRRLREAAERCFEAVAGDAEGVARWGFNPYSHSVRLGALAEFGCSREELEELPRRAEIDALFRKAMGGEWACQMEECWARKKFPARSAGDARYRLQDWHQDGALGARFPPDAGAAIPMTELATCWIALTPCGGESPGLEFVRERLAGLLHFTELDDAALRRRFRAEQFWAPALEAGDALVFGNATLHRTYVRAEMRRDRLSVEYRAFPAR